MRTIFSILLLFISHFIFAQCNGYKYIPFPESGGKWHVLEYEQYYSGYDAFEGDYYQAGDSIINLKKYSIIKRNGIFDSWGTTSLLDEVVGFMRQDTTLKFVYFKPVNKPEYLLYDFSKKLIGASYVQNNKHYYSTDEDGVVLNDGIHRYLKLAPSFSTNGNGNIVNDSNKIIIEGVGNECGFIDDLFDDYSYSPSGWGNTDIRFSRLLSFSINDSLFFSNPYSASFYLNKYSSLYDPTFSIEIPFTYSNLIPYKILYVKNCINKSYVFYGDTIYNEGSYYHIQKSICDTLIVLNLSQKKKIVFDSSTFFKPYFFNNKFIKSEGTYFDTIQSISGCDSLIELHLSKYYLSITQLNVYLCTGDVFYLNGNTYTSVPSSVNDTMQDIAGRDSVIIRYSITAPYLHIHNSTVNLPVGVCTYSPYGHLINRSGIYDFITNVNGGCDSIDRMDIRFKNGSSTQAITLTHCNLGYNFNGRLLTTAGIYFDTLTNIYGCDSISILKLFFHRKSNNQTQNFQICKGDTLKIGKYNHIYQGTYSDTLPDYLGCDSIIKVSITYYYPKYGSKYNLIYLKPCDSFFLYNGRKIKYIDYYKNKNYYNQNVTWFDDTIHSQLGCAYDSVIQYKIYFVQPYINLIKTIPLGSFYNFYGQHLYQSGNYSKIFQTPCGTDSTVYLNLDVRADYHYIIDTSVFMCKLPYHFYGSLLSQAGTFYDTLVSQIGMDSIIIIKLNVFDTIDTWIDTSSFCQDSILIGNTFYNQAGWNFKQTLSSYKGCDSTIHIDIRYFFPPLKISLGSDQVMHGSPITINMYTSSSVDTFFCSNGDTIFYPNKSITFNSAGTYVVKAKSYFGCVAYDTITISYPLNSININRQSEIKISPNPCTDELKILNSDFKIKKLEVINVVGQIVLNQQVNNSTTQSINVSSLTQGIYLLKCTDENGMVHQAKFVKQ